MLVFTYLLLFTLSSLAYLPVTYLLCFTYITSNDVHADLCLFYLFTLIYFIFLSTTYLLKACFKVSSHHGPCTTLHPFLTLIPCTQHTHTHSCIPERGCVIEVRRDTMSHCVPGWGDGEGNSSTVSQSPRMRHRGTETLWHVLVSQNKAQKSNTLRRHSSRPKKTGWGWDNGYDVSSHERDEIFTGSSSSSVWRSEGWKSAKSVGGWVPRTRLVVWQDMN